MPRIKKPTIHQQIKSLRKQKGYNQTELAERSNLKQPDISAFESGVRLPSYLVLKRIADALETDVVLQPKNA